MEIPPDTLDFWRRHRADVAGEIHAARARLAWACAAWELVPIAGPLRGGLTSVVWHVRRAGVDLALKCTPAFATWCRDEGVALACWAGEGAVRRIDRSADGHVQLLEWLAPAGMVDDEEVAGVVRALHRDVAEGAALLDLSERVGSMYAWAHGLAQDRVEVAHLQRAEPLARELVASTQDRVIVHGDLQGKNVMRRAGEVVAIDPIPALGDGAFDVALWCLSVPPWEHATVRAEVLAEAGGCHPDRAVRWVRALAAVVATWPQEPARRAVCGRLCA